MTGKSEPGPTDPMRREFILRSARAGLAAVAAGALAYRFCDPVGPKGPEETSPGVRLADFSLKGLPPRMAVVRGPDRTATLRRALEAVGGMERYIQRGDRVVLKVNAAFASPPMLSATTHPDVVAEVVRQCLRAGADTVRVTDHPINDPASCFVLSGIMESARSNGAEVVLPRADLFRPTTVPGGRLIRDWPVLFGPSAPRSWTGGGVCPGGFTTPCIVCQENCPVSPKAIFTRDVYEPVGEGGPLRVVRAEEDTVELEADRLPAERLDTGDYFCRVSGRPEEPLRRIVANAASRVELSPAPPWRTVPAPGSEVDIRIRLQRPVVRAEACIGCGVCEHVCPVRGERAIRVTAENETRNHEHQMILMG